MNNYEKRTLTKLHRLYCLLTLLFICACTDVPEYCSDHNLLDPFTQFCYQGKAVNKCNGAQYDPSAQFCYQNKTLINKCGGAEYDPATQGCYGGIVRSDANILTVNIEPTGGGTVSRSPNQTNYKWGTTVTVTATAASGYKFTGWSDAATDTANSVKVAMDGDKTLTANFYKEGGEQSTYFVYFNANGAKGDAPAAVQRSYGGVITLPNQAGLTRDGYSFAGWNTAADGGGAAYNTGNTYTVTGTVTLFAQWTRNTYTLTTAVSPSGSGTVSRDPNKTTYQYGESVTVTATPANNYTFYNWSGASSSTNAVITITMDDDKALTAGFGARNAKRFFVTFDSNGGGSAPAVASADSGSNITLPGQQSMVKTGYEFNGWNTSANGSGTGYAANYSYKVTGDVTLYAQWTAISYTYIITLNANGGTLSGGTSVTTNMDGKLASLPAAPSRPGYTFNDWYTLSSGGTRITTNYVFSSNTTIYAQWTTTTYTIGYTLNGGSVTGNPASYTIETPTFTLYNPTKTDYTFTGWTGSNGTTAQTSVTIEKGSTGNRSYTANWQQNVVTPTTYKVTISGGGAGASGGGDYAAGVTVNISAGTQTGYVFDKWTASGVTIPNPNSPSTSFTMPANAVTVTANWQNVPIVTPGNNVSQTVGGYTFEMVPVEGGTFTMGCTSEQGSDCYDAEKPSHSVTVNTFYIGKYEVTQGLWKAVMGSLPTSISSSYGIGDEYPVYYVSWNTIVNNFLPELKRLTGRDYRLPTEAEWEYAARGGKNSQGYKYSGSNTIGDVAWYTSNSGSKTHEVGTKSPNELGLYDMSGNVWEWVSDWYGSSYYSSSPAANPTGPTSGSIRVFRGGGWFDDAWYCRVSYRSGFNPGNYFTDVGFRLVLLSP